MPSYLGLNIFDTVMNLWFNYKTIKFNDLAQKKTEKTTFIGKNHTFTVDKTLNVRCRFYFSNIKFCKKKLFKFERLKNNIFLNNNNIFLLILKKIKEILYDQNLSIYSVKMFFFY